ncbi:serine/threonine-protein kinase [Streptomyces sp. NPDC005209]|uniref:serine/threonine-protein kinase n=1 Tax=Streptomyces sp. NPDC005209 TaxID=3156715 RepID=UPI0033B3912B
MSEGESGRRIVDGRFALQARLGGGGMGTVWRAQDLLLHRDVAIKEVRPPDAGLAEYDPDGARTLRERVLREARALARVDHPNVVTIHHIVDGGPDTYPWIVMELVQGGSLADRLNHGPMHPAEAAQLGQGVLSALRAAHAAGVQHRDVKPANVLLRPDGRPVLTDFGIAALRESTALTVTGALIGTPDYMAPERISGGPGGPEADLWSLAMMLYVAVEGQHPMRRGTTLATLAAVLYDEVPPPTHAGPLTDLLNRVLVKDPAVRPDAETVERMLAAAAAARPAPEQQATSYQLAPPMPAQQPRDAAPWTSTPNTAGGAGAFGTTTAGGFGAFGSTTAGGAGAFGVTTAGDAGPVDAHAVTKRTERPRRTRNIVIACSVVATVAVGGVIQALVYNGGDHDAGSDSTDPTNSPRQTASRTPGATSGGADDQGSGGATDRTSGDSKTTDLLTPDGIRTALKAIERETGRDSFGDFSVYPEYVNAQVMVAGSRTSYDTYTYRVNGGVEKGIIKGKLMGGEQPLTLDNFNWDAVPALLAEAKKKLKVDKPTSRYLLIRQPNNIFDTPAGMAIYLSDQYDHGGYMEADPHGKVTKTMAD